MTNHHDLANFIWSIADLLRGPYRPPQYERVMLPLTVLRRFDCVLAKTKADVLVAHARYKDKHQGEALDMLLNKVAGQRFHNHSPLTFEKLKGDPDNIHQHLVSYIQGFSENVRKIFERFEFANEIERMREHNILYLVVTRFCDVELHPRRIDNMQMGLLFEDLIRRFNEQANETAGDHFTPREVIRLMVNLLFMHDDDLLTKPGTLRKLLDPTCGTGGMLSEARKYLREHNLTAKLYVYGQDFNPRSYAVAASDLLLKEGPEERERTSRIEFGDSLVDDHFPSYDADTKGRFDYFLANPPFGVDWKRQQKEIVREHEKLGFAGRFGAGLPRVNDGALLFLQHMVSKFEPVNPKENRDGSRLAIVFNGSPLFTGGAGSGESEIRRWIIENDWLEAIVALPEQMFYNTGIGTYIWVVTNRKEPRRKGKIQLLDARECWVPLRRSLGDKRRKLAGGEEEDNEKVFSYPMPHPCPAPCPTPCPTHALPMPYPHPTCPAMHWPVAAAACHCRCPARGRRPGSAPSSHGPPAHTRGGRGDGGEGGNRPPHPHPGPGPRAHVETGAAWRPCHQKPAAACRQSESEAGSSLQAD